MDTRIQHHFVADPDRHAGNTVKEKKKRKAIPGFELIHPDSLWAPDRTGTDQAKDASPDDRLTGGPIVCR